MLPNDRAQPAAPDKPSWGSRLLRVYRRAPAWLKVAVVAIAVVLSPATLGLIILAALVYAVVSVVPGTAHRGRDRLGRALGLSSSSPRRAART